MYWKHYALYCNNDKIKCSHSKKLGNLLSQLRENDISGPSCNTKLYEGLPIQNNIPSEFICRNVVRCSNYRIDKKIDPIIQHIPPGYGVSMSISQEDNCDMDKVTNLVSNNGVIPTVGVTPLRTKRNAYAELVPIFKELVQHLQNNDSSHLDRVQSLLRRELNIVKKVEDEGTKFPKGTFVSSSSNFVKKRKTHGTKYYRK